ncbi:MAG: hypothetical protein M1140_11810 [Chloroflexi bacterium]|nr:hypothetical protein [Chloroflexota bacterium]
MLGTVRKYVDRIRFMHYKDITFDGRPNGELWPGGPVTPSDAGAYGVDSKGRWVELGRGAAPFREITQILLDGGLGIWGERDRRNPNATLPPAMQ